LFNTYLLSFLNIFIVKSKLILTCPFSNFVDSLVTACDTAIVGIPYDADSIAAPNVPDVVSSAFPKL